MIYERFSYLRAITLMLTSVWLDRALIVWSNAKGRTAERKCCSDYEPPERG
jgi:hypothetical protein